MTRLIIDTHIYSYALVGAPDVVDALRTVNKIFICIISIGELLFGFKGGSRENENREELAIFLDAPRVRILPLNEETAEFYAEILSNLRKVGRPIPTNDIWIGAVALQHGLKLYSKDHHFSFIPGLLVKN